MANHVVRPSQTAIMQRQNILDGVVTLHETVHELHSKKLNQSYYRIQDYIIGTCPRHNVEARKRKNSQINEKSKI
jgi:hypothetical protein